MQHEKSHIQYHIDNNFQKVAADEIRENAFLLCFLPINVAKTKKPHFGSKEIRNSD